MRSPIPRALVRLYYGYLSGPTNRPSSPLAPFLSPLLSFVYLLAEAQGMVGHDAKEVMSGFTLVSFSLIDH